MTSLDRRRLLLLAAAASGTWLSRTASAQTGGTFTYRGITVDISAAQGLPNLAVITNSLKHQVDIVVDCGARADVLTFFKAQEVFVKPGQTDGGGHFAANSNGVTIDAAVDAPEKPVLLHELLHAYHFRVLPQAFANPDVLRFYDNAREGACYPPDSYVMKNVREFFAVTASLYLWGNVDRPPHNRATLREKQPVYYRWLGEQFGVLKGA